jgi:hypothetical protein
MAYSELEVLNRDGKMKTRDGLMCCHLCMRTRSSVP